MSDEIRHECAVAMVVLRTVGATAPIAPKGDFGGTKLSLLLEKQHNRGQDGAGAAILSGRPVPGAPPYRLFKSASATPLADVLGMIGRREAQAGERVFLGHLRYATFGKNELRYCHPFVHEASDLRHTLLLAGNFNLTNAADLFDAYSRAGAFPTSRADGYLLTELVARERVRGRSLADALRDALASADGAWTLVGATGAGEAFAVRDPHGIRPGYYYVDEDVVVVASERPAIQAAFDVPPEAVRELPPGEVLIVAPDGRVALVAPTGRARSPSEPRVPAARSVNAPYQGDWDNRPYQRGGFGKAALPSVRSCVFERIYFSRANDADIHRERTALGAALVPAVLEAAAAPPEDVFFSYIPNSARTAFHGLLARLFAVRGRVRFGEVIVKDAKFRTFIADAAARREFYKHVYDVTYGLVRPGRDALVVLDDSIVRGNTMKNAILPMLDRLGPQRIVVASSAPPIRYPDCYGIDMSTLGELVAFKALVNLLGADAEAALRGALASAEENPLAALYGRFAEGEHAAEIARLLTPPGMKAEVAVVYQTLDALHAACPQARGDWYFTGDYPTPGGYRVLRTALANYLERKSERSY